MIQIKNKGKLDDYVYDISLDGTVVNALGLNIMKQTDGFNFRLPTDDVVATPVYLDYVVPQNEGTNDEFSEDDKFWIKNVETGDIISVTLNDIVENKIDYEYEILTSNGYVNRKDFVIEEA
jgi:hypothetical protein